MHTAPAVPLSGRPSSWLEDENGSVPHVRYGRRRRATVATTSSVARTRRSCAPPVPVAFIGRTGRRCACTWSPREDGAGPPHERRGRIPGGPHGEGLFITDASSLPDGLGGPNPTRTNQMFATRTAEHLATGIFGRDPFVCEGTGRTDPAGFGMGGPPSAAAPHAGPQAARRPLPTTGGGLAVARAAPGVAWAMRASLRTDEHDDRVPNAT